MYQASCLCAAVKVEVTSGISDIIHCHCSLCRKNSGTAYATNGFVLRDGFNVVEGKELLSGFSFKPGSIRYFCQCCGSPIYSENLQDPDRIRLRLGALDTPIVERPISHNFISSKADWEQLDKPLPQYEGFEPSRQK